MKLKCFQRIMIDSNTKETILINKISWPFSDIILQKQETVRKIKKLLKELCHCKKNRQSHIPVENQALLFRHRVLLLFQAKDLAMVALNVHNSHILVATQTLVLGNLISFLIKLEEQLLMFLPFAYQILQSMSSAVPQRQYVSVIRLRSLILDAFLRGPVVPPILTHRKLLLILEPQEVCR